MSQSMQPASSPANQGVNCLTISGGVPIDWLYLACFNKTYVCTGIVYKIFIDYKCILKVSWPYIA